MAKGIDTEPKDGKLSKAEEIFKENWFSDLPAMDAFKRGINQALECVEHLESQLAELQQEKSDISDYGYVLNVARTWKEAKQREDELAKQLAESNARADRWAALAQEAGCTECSPTYDELRTQLAESNRLLREKQGVIHVIQHHPEIVETCTVESCREVVRHLEEKS